MCTSSSKDADIEIKSNVEVFESICALRHRFVFSCECLKTCQCVQCAPIGLKTRREFEKAATGNCQRMGCQGPCHLIVVKVIKDSWHEIGFHKMKIRSNLSTTQLHHTHTHVEWAAWGKHSWALQLPPFFSQDAKLLKCLFTSLSWHLFWLFYGRVLYCKSLMTCNSVHSANHNQMFSLE